MLCVLIRSAARADLSSLNMKDGNEYLPSAAENGILPE
jgi:hypothetical protein